MSDPSDGSVVGDTVVAGVDEPGAAVVAGDTTVVPVPGTVVAGAVVAVPDVVVGAPGATVVVLTVGS